MDDEAIVYVPVERWAHRIDPRSGIVGRPEDRNGLAGGEAVHIYYEGNRFGASNIVTFADRCDHAHGRMVENYPTVAQRMVPLDLLTRVGTFLPRLGVQLDGEAACLIALAKWLDVDLEDTRQRVRLQAELQLDGGRR